jgi:hypothetical protein
MNKQKKFLIFFFSLFILTIGLSKAQGNDYIINNSGEKIYGEILRNFDFNNYETIRFRTGTNEEIAYSPKDIEGFGLGNGRFFLSLELPELEEKVFAQIIFSGKINLISYKSRYFIETSDQIIELKSSFKTIDESGRHVKNTNRKPYLGILNLVMAGNCGTELKSSIVLTGFNDQDFISILQKYHICENLPYQIHIEKIPFLRISPVLGLGFNFSSKPNNYGEIKRYDVFDKNLFPMVQAGIKLNDFRDVPRFSIDVSVGYTSQNNTVNLEHIKEGVILTGTETFQLSSAFVPVFFNYSFYSNSIFESYLGIGGVYRTFNFESEFSIVDLHYTFGEVTNIYEIPIVTQIDQIFSPAVKIGMYFKSKGRMGITSEIQVDYLKNAISLDLFNNMTKYDQIMFSFLIGVRF